MYNLTNVTNASNIYGQMVAMNQVSEGYIGIFILASLFVIMLYVLKRTEQDTKEILLIDSVVCSIVGVLMWTMKFISWDIVIYPILLLIASLLIFKFSS